MTRQNLLAIGAITALCLTGAAQAADKPAKAVVKAAPAAAPVVEAVQDCSDFYDPYRRRGFGWGVGPGTGLGFGTFEGALPRYPRNEFPNWYGTCVNWGHYSAAGSALD